MMIKQRSEHEEITEKHVEVTLLDNISREDLNDQTEFLAPRNKGDKFNIPKVGTNPNYNQEQEFSAQEFSAQELSAPAERTSQDSPDQAKKSESDNTGYFQHSSTLNAVLPPNNFGQPREEQSNSFKFSRINSLNVPIISPKRAVSQYGQQLHEI